MKCYHLSFICLILASVVVAACAQDISTNDWHPNTRLLDIAAKHNDPITGDAGSTLARDVETFYQLLRDKKWHETYEQHAKVYRNDILEADYLATTKEAEKSWSLVNYEILNLQFENSYGSTNVDEAVLICKFTELPGHTDSYSTVYWHREEGVWKCLSAGPSKIHIFEATRSPFMVWQ